MTTAADKIRAKVFAQTGEEAMAVYAALRLLVMGTRDRKDRETLEAAWVATVEAGNALEERIGEERFDALMKSVDDHLHEGV